MASSAHVNSKQLRNDLLTLCSLISNLCPDAPFVVSSHTTSLLLLSLSLSDYPFPPSSHLPSFPQETGFLHDLCSYFLAFEGVLYIKFTIKSLQDIKCTQKEKNSLNGLEKA